MSELSLNPPKISKLEFHKISPTLPHNTQCHSEEHPEVAAQALILAVLEGVEEAGDLEAEVVVRNSSHSREELC